MLEDRLTNSYGWRVGADCWWEVLVPLPEGLSVGLVDCVYSILADFHQSGPSKKPSTLQCLDSMSLEVTHCHVCCTYHADQLCFNMEGE